MTRRISTLIVSCVAGVAGTLGITTLAQAGDVSVAVNVAAPGVYGQITLGDLPRPELLMPRPVVAVPAQVVVGAPPPEPLYLHVPPGHERHWARHCHEYNACGRPVYFVSDHWYQQVYVPHHAYHEEGRRYEEHREHEWEREHEHGHGHDRDHDRDHDHDRDRDDYHDHGHRDYRD